MTAHNYRVHTKSFLQVTKDKVNDTLLTKAPDPVYLPFITRALKSTRDRTSWAPPLHSPSERRHAKDFLVF